MQIFPTLINLEAFSKKGESHKRGGMGGATGGKPKTLGGRAPGPTPPILSVDLYNIGAIVTSHEAQSAMPPLPPLSSARSPEPETRCTL